MTQKIITPVVLIDMDGVLADFDTALEQQILLAHPEFIAPNRELDFYLSRRTEDQTILMHDEIIKNKEGFFRNLPVIDGALEAWQRIIDLGYHPRICTAPLSSNVYCATEKIAWLEEHLGADVAAEAIVDRDKWKYDGITLIDDRPVVHGADKATWVHTVFSQPYNQTIDTEFRLADWRDPNLSAILARCTERSLTSQS